ncbi:helix-turn-helix domain-containing protein [Mycobacterium sp. CBMA226]|nr:helix-turn-helix domain-containing protein [Mycolicibacterium sp. CBMA 226]
MTTKTRLAPNLIGVPQAAEYADVHYRTMRRWIQEGRIRAVRVGPKLLKVDLNELERFIAGGAR